MHIEHLLGVCVVCCHVAYYVVALLVVKHNPVFQYNLVQIVLSVHVQSLWD